jgi:hypothetical protein
MVTSLWGPSDALAPASVTLAGAFLFRAATMAPRHRYSVIVTRAARDHWMWEVQRVPPLGIRLYGENFNSARAAKVEGEKAVKSLLKSLANEKTDV